MALKVDANKLLIVQFMGAKFLNDDPRNWPDGYWYGEEVPEIMPSYWDYDSSWDWLMPVVEKIEELMPDISTMICKRGGSNEYEAIIGIGNWHATAATKIEATYQAVLAFIKWYNTQPKN